MPLNRYSADFVENDTFLDCVDVPCDDEVQDETKPAMHVSRLLFQASIGAPLQGRGTYLLGNDTVLDFSYERCNDSLHSKPTSSLHVGQPLIATSGYVHVDECGVVASTIHITECADPIEHSSDDTSKFGVDFNYNGSIFGSATVIMLLHSVGSL